MVWFIIIGGVLLFWVYKCLEHIDSVHTCWHQVPRVWKHYLCYLKTEKRILGRYKYLTHDLDKLAMYIFLPFLGYAKIKQIHRERSKHHILAGKLPRDIDYEAAMIDWECSRFTKLDSQKTAREYLVSKKGVMSKVDYSIMCFILKKYGL